MNRERAERTAKMVADKLERILAERDGERCSVTNCPKRMRCGGATPAAALEGSNVIQFPATRRHRHLSIETDL